MELELAERARRGDREAFADLVRVHQPALSRFAGRSAASREEADDVVQESFLRAWQQMTRFRPGTNFRAWVFTIARFLMMARRKDRQRRPPPAAIEPGLEPVAPPLAEPLERLRREVDALPARQREVVALRFFDGFDYRSIAELTGETEVALRSRLHDALERLRSSLVQPEL
jgi:RNA polymerase sigma-70 factor (ECF subfamily)